MWYWRLFYSKGEAPNLLGLEKCKEVLSRGPDGAEFIKAMLQTLV